MRFSWLSIVLTAVPALQLAFCVLPEPAYDGYYMRQDPDHPNYLSGFYGELPEKLTNKEMAWLAWKAAEQMKNIFTANPQHGGIRWRPGDVTLWQEDIDNNLWIVSSGNGNHGEMNIIDISENAISGEVHGGQVLSFALKKTLGIPGLQKCCDECKKAVIKRDATDLWTSGMFPDNDGWIVKWDRERGWFLYQSKYDSHTWSREQPNWIEESPNLPAGWKMFKDRSEGVYMYQPPGKGKVQSKSPCPTRQAQEPAPVVASAASGSVEYSAGPSGHTKRIEESSGGQYYSRSCKDPETDNIPGGLPASKPPKPHLSPPHPVVVAPSPAGIAGQKGTALVTTKAPGRGPKVAGQELVDTLKAGGKEPTEASNPSR